MNWSNAIEVLAAFALMLVAGFIFLRAPLLVAFTQRPSDITSIKARYEGLTSPAGPYSVVQSVERAGCYVSRTRSARGYDVALRMSGGKTVTRRVYVGAGVFDDGEVWE